MARKPLCYQLEPYGTVPPWESRLLKVLPNGFPLFEPTSLQQPEEDDGLFAEEEEEATTGTVPATSTEELELANKLLLGAERRVKGITGELDQLRQHVEKFFVVEDRELREKAQESDPLLRNAPKWQSTALDKTAALAEIASLREVFRLATETGKEAQLTFVPSLRLLSPKAEWLSLASAIARRRDLILPFLKATETALSEIGTSIKQQLRFLYILLAVRTYWKLQKVPYAAHVYSKGEEYPYRAEIRVDFFAPPSTCWGFDSPRRWVLPPTATARVAVPIGAVTPAPFESWPPLPPAPPAAPAVAEVFFVGEPNSRGACNPKADNADSASGPSSPSDSPPTNSPPGEELPLGVQIRWVGDTSHCVENSRQLQVRIVPTSITQIAPSDSSSIHETTACFQEKKELPFSLLPSADGESASWPAEARELHRQLQTAQWRLVDRLAHLVFQAQAARLKDILDVAAYGSSAASSNAWDILAEFEGIRKTLPIFLRMKSDKTDSSDQEMSQGEMAQGNVLQGSQKGVSQKRTTIQGMARRVAREVAREATREVTRDVTRELTVERWDTYMTSLALRDIPVFFPIMSNPEDITGAKFKVDLEVWVNYLPSGEEDVGNPPSRCSVSASTGGNPHGFSPAPAADATQLPAAGSPFVTEFLRRIPILESLAVCFLRHLILTAWKKTIRDVPEACFDIYPTSIASTRQPAGARVFVEFVDWLTHFLASRMLTRMEQEPCGTTS